MKKTWGYIAGGVILLAIILGVYAYSHNNNSKQATSTVPSNGANNDQTTTSSTTAGSSGTKPAAKLSYGDAIKTYKYRFQFSQCHGTPGSMVVKKGDIVMLDNSDA